jgi:hypothetical protein
LLENGGAIFDSNLFNMFDLANSGPGRPPILVNVSQINSPTAAATATETQSSVVFCESSIDSAFCIDYAALVTMS